MSLISKKICILGESEVGKNSLIYRFVERQFSDEYLSTVGVQISRKTLQLYRFRLGSHCMLKGRQFLVEFGRRNS
jgi:GTPase SAR1 family protein